MTTATRPLPPHGTYARANGSPGYREPCPCQPCRTAWCRARKQQRIARQLGRSAMTDAGPARTHLAELADAMHWTTIATRTGTSVSHLTAIAGGRIPRIRTTTLQRILAVSPDPATANWSVDVTSTRRRIQALYAMGHGQVSISRATGMSQTRISHIANGHVTSVDITTARRIAAAYGPLIQRPGASAKARVVATRHGWHGPAAWDDIDDPTAEPEVDDTPPTRHRLLLAEQRREDIRHLADCGVPEHEIARRVGMAPAYVHDIIHNLRRAAR